MCIRDRCIAARHGSCDDRGAQGVRYPGARPPDGGNAEGRAPEHSSESFSGVKIPRRAGVLCRRRRQPRACGAAADRTWNAARSRQSPGLQKSGGDLPSEACELPRRARGVRFPVQPGGGGPAAVSYTHLDVYKRQALAAPASSASAPASIPP